MQHNALDCLRPRLECFADCLKRILAENGISATELSRLMGISGSKTKVFRILSNEASYKNQLAFFKCIRETCADKFSDCEFNELSDALEISRVGETQYLCNCAISELVFKADEKVCNETCMYVRGSDDSLTPLADVLVKVFDAEDAHLTITGSCTESLFRAIDEALAKKRPGGTISIDHYLPVSAAEFVKAIVSLQPFIYRSDYHLLVFSEDDRISDVTRQLYVTGRILLQMQINGEMRSLVMLCTDDEHMFISEVTPTEYAFMVSCLHENDCRMRNLNTLYAEKSSPETYLRYIESLYELEHNRDIYRIKQDIPIDYIHPDPLTLSMREGFLATGLADKGSIDELTSAFYAMHMKRYKNIIEKKRVTHTVFAAEAMRRFARTGQTSDHFFAMRPYTPTERLRILCDLFVQAQNNPYFSIYFFREDIHPVAQELCLYDGAGLMMTKPFTDFRLDGEHNETLVVQRMFCDCFRTYFMEKLLPQLVMSEKEARTLMNELIDIIRLEVSL